MNQSIYRLRDLLPGTRFCVAISSDIMTKMPGDPSETSMGDFYPVKNENGEMVELYGEAQVKIVE